MHRFPIHVAAPFAALALAAVVAACGASASPAVTASPAPSQPTTVAPASPTSQPSGSPSTGAIDLDTADAHDVTVVVRDPGKALVGVRSGRAGDGMSVRWGEVEVVNVDDDTVRVTWVGLPVDAGIVLAVAARGDGYALTFTQPAPPADSDAIGFDRVLELDFASPVRAADIEAVFRTA